MTQVWTPSHVNVAGHEVGALLNDGNRHLPAVIFIHGILSSIELWPAILPDIQNRYRCCSLSLPGHAPSTTPDSFGSADVTSELFADVVVAAAEKFFPDQRCHLVGWSTGGFAALAAAAWRPDMVASVTGISAFARGRWHDMLGILQWLAASGWSRPGCRWTIRQLAHFPWILDRILQRFTGGTPIPDWTASSPNDTACVGWKSLHTSIGQHNPRELTTMMQGIRPLDLTSQLGLVQAPTQIISGRRDRIVRHSEAVHLAGAIAGAKLVERPESGHLFFAEALDEVLPCVFEWIDAA